MGFSRRDFVTVDSQLENVQLLRELVQDLILLAVRLAVPAPG